MGQSNFAGLPLLLSMQQGTIPCCAIFMLMDDFYNAGIHPVMARFFTACVMSLCRLRLQQRG